MGLALRKREKWHLVCATVYFNWLTDYTEKMESLRSTVFCYLSKESKQDLMYQLVVAKRDTAAYSHLLSDVYGQPDAVPDKVAFFHFNQAVHFQSKVFVQTCST